MRIWLVIAVLGCGDSKSREPAGEAPKTDPRLALDLPQVAKGFLPFVEAPTTVTVTRDAITMDGTPIVAVRAGAVPVEEKEHGKLGIKIDKLHRFTVATVEKTKADRAALLFDRATPYRLMMEVMFSMKQQGGLRRFELVGKSGGALVSAPVVLPDRTRPSVAWVGRRQPGADLDRQLAQVKAEGDKVRAGTARRGLEWKSATVTPSTVTIDIVKSKIAAAYAAGLRRCVGTPDAGKQHVTIEATIDPAGRVVDGKVRGKREVATCIEGKIAGWRFPIPKDADGEATRATFNVELELDAPFADVAGLHQSNARVDMLTAEDPTAAEPPPPVGNPDEQPLGMFVSMTRDRVIVWSLSGLEGTLRDPRYTYPADAPDAMQRLAADLADLVKRRWGGRQRPADSTTIVIMAAPDTTAQRVAELIASVRESFPDLQFSLGFE